MTPEEQRELDMRLLAAHERAGHLKSARWYREKYGLAEPQPQETPPSYEVIKAEWTTLGLDPIIKDFWQFHAGQDHPGVGKRNYELAYERVRKAAILAAGSHKRAKVWIPLRVPCGAPMKFIAVTPGTPKGERDYSQSHYKTVEALT